MLIRMQLSLPRDSRYVALLRDVANCILSDLDAPPEAVDDIQIALAEACANAVRHAVHSDGYSVGLGVDGDGCEIIVSDFGPGFDPVGGDEAPTDPLDPEMESGRGLLLMRSLMDELHFDRADEGTEVRLVKRWRDLPLHLEREGYRTAEVDDEVADATT